MKPQAGVGRTSLTPTKPVELTGWGYYLERIWRDVHDPLYATALVVDNGDKRLAVISVDLMVISAEFTRSVREQIAAETEIPAANILVCATHTHNAPASGGLRGVGEVDPEYETWAAELTARAAITAWDERVPATFCVGSSTESKEPFDSMRSTTEWTTTFNRTRPDGLVDQTITTLRVDREDGSPLAAVVGFQAHPTVWTVLRPYSVSRDMPGALCDAIEQAFPGCTALYLQGACGDVNFDRSWSESEERAEFAARLFTETVAVTFSRSHHKYFLCNHELDLSQLGVTSRIVRLPTRRWTLEEIQHDREEAERRLKDHDLTGWRDTIGRVMTNRPDDMVARHGGDEWKAVAAMCRFNMEWTDQMLEDYETRPEWLETEIQAIRIGDFGIVSNSSEFFTTLALSVREKVKLPYLMLACYANGRIGYLPDAYDVERKTYASYQSPKYCNQFLFTAESGPVMVEAMSELMNSLS